MPIFKKLLFTALIFCLFPFLSVASAQTPIRGEFIESSSPTRSGGSVTTRAEPGRRIQTTITMPRNSVPRVAANPQGARAGNSAGGNSILETSGSGSTIRAQAASSSQSTSDGNRYPYPAKYSPRVAANPFQPNPNAGRVSASRPQLFQGNNCNCGPQVPVSGLGLTARAPTFNSTLGRPVPTSGYQQAPLGGQPLVGQGVQPVLSQAPQLQFQVPGQAQAGVQQFNSGQIGVPQFGVQQPNVAQYPWLSGTPSAYRPLVGIFNMPQGTFLGQGIIGQPEAYVNGQPVANFFRYLFPF